MSNTVIKIENLSKIYRLGEVGTGTLSHDLNRWWKMNVMRQDDPYAKIGRVNDRTQKAEKGELIAAVRDINLEVKQGEVLGIIGKNGAGKSTLLKLLSRVTSPTTGTIKTKGRLASLLEVGTGFHPEMTGKENIYMNGTIMGMRKWEISRKLDEIVDFAGVAKYLDTPVKRYSSGMTVRLGFAVAAFLEPEILIVDEVLAVGDAEFQKKAIGKMQDISKGDGRTVLFVSHNMGSVLSLCSIGMLLENGMIAFQGTTDDAVAKYLNGNKVTVSDISQIEDRSGEGNIFFTNVLIGNPYNKQPIFKLGEKIGFHLSFKVKNRIATNKLKVLVGVYNEKDEGILRFDSDVNSKLVFDDQLIEGMISCILEDHLTIMPGKYSVNIALFNNGIMEDYLAGKILFDVVNENYLGGSRTPDNYNLAKVLYKHNWTLTKS